ncbi:MAG: hypothetical protein ABJF04_14105 [Reichenbachiella sp.]|uniref:hypothetical protein n=1 Tax=Reichenbachiella sp. TaxID=2184521 RepID=UPI0032678BDD
MSFKYLTGCIIFLWSTNALAQSFNPSPAGNGAIYYDGGNVGIGSSGPGYRLDVHQVMNSDNGYESVLRIVGKRGGSNHQHPMLTFGTEKASNGVLELGAITSFYQWGGEGGLQFLTKQADQDLMPRMTIDRYGNVGIGTNEPGNQLEVHQVLNSDNGYESVLRIVGKRGGSNHQHPMLTFGTEKASNGVLELGAITSFYQWGGEGGLQFLTKQADHDLTPRMTIDRYGNVGIGTTTPDSKLTVAGKIHSQEVQVTVNAGADFVFEEDYDLTSLEELDQYVKENKHLPEIASAKEMESEGIHLAELNIKLLQKIEELTLHLIEQNRRIEELEKKVTN